MSHNPGAQLAENTITCPLRACICLLKASQYYTYRRVLRFVPRSPDHEQSHNPTCYSHAFQRGCQVSLSIWSGLTSQALVFTMVLICFGMCRVVPRAPKHSKSNDPTCNSHAFLTKCQSPLGIWSAPWPEHQFLQGFSSVDVLQSLCDRVAIRPICDRANTRSGILLRDRGCDRDRAVSAIGQPSASPSRLKVRDRA